MGRGAFRVTSAFESLDIDIVLPDDAIQVVHKAHPSTGTSHHAVRQ